MSSDIPTRLFEAERSFRRACDQVTSLNRAIQEIQERYDRAGRNHCRMFRYSLRLRMAVTEGVRNMFYEYATIKADEITDLRCQINSDEELSDSEVSSNYSYECDSDDISSHNVEDTETDDTTVNFQALSTSDGEINDLSRPESNTEHVGSSNQSTPGKLEESTNL